MASLESYIQPIYDYKPAYPSRLPEGEIFGLSRSAPWLDRTRTNRILVYPGSFNPPHQGHLRLLKHVFLHGCHDLNVIAAIILPRSDSSVLAKCKQAGGTFMFGKDERCLLWKQDIAFPTWAWVYEDNDFQAFQRQLKEAIKEDGYRTEFVMLYGPNIASPDNSPTAAYSYKTMIMSNAAREANYQRSSGRLKTLNDCSRWRPIHINKERLEHWTGIRVLHRLLDMHTICPKEAQSMLDDGPDYVVRTTEADVAYAIEDLGNGNVLYCERQLEIRKLTVRFVKGESGTNEISSSRVRAAMQTQHRKYQREALEFMALSSQVLWWYRSSWVEKARLGTGDCINFPPVFEDDVDLLCDPGDCSEDRFEEQKFVKKKKQCLLATRQGASSGMKSPPACEDDLVLGMKNQEPNPSQRLRRHSC